MTTGNSLAKVSVVVLNYNGLKYLFRTLPPLQALCWPNLEIIVVDNGSNDGSVEYLRTFRSIRLIENGCNLGYSAAKNRGVQEAGGEYILLLDNDILLPEPDLIQVLIEQLGPEIAFLSLPLENEGQERTPYYGNYFSFYGLDLHKPKVGLSQILSLETPTISTGYCAGALLFFRRQIWSELGGFDEQQPFFLDDSDVGPRAWVYGYACTVYTKAYAVHLGVQNQLEINGLIWRNRLFFSGIARSLVKNMRGYNVVRILPLFFMFCLLKAVKDAVLFGSWSIFLAFWSSVWRFLTVLPDSFRHRARVQHRRICQHDVFLRVKRPRFESER